MSEGHWFNTSYISRKYVGCSHEIALLEYELEPSPTTETCFSLLALQIHERRWLDVATKTPHVPVGLLLLL